MVIKARQYKAGEIIFREGDIGESAYIIEVGRVEVLKRLEGNDIHLSYLGAGEPFGEMGVINEKPRSATVMAVEDSVVRELHRDEFVHSLQTTPEAALHLLGTIFERLREADATILQLHRDRSQETPALASILREEGVQPAMVLSLEGLIPKAVQSLPANPFRITKFPFRIGRQSDDPLVHNDLSIPDTVPWQISRHHLALVCHDNRIGVSDRGSRLGALVDGKQVGGRKGHDGPLFFTGAEGTLVLGTPQSPFKYKVRLIKQDECTRPAVEGT